MKLRFLRENMGRITISNPVQVSGRKVVSVVFLLVIQARLLTNDVLRPLCHNR